MPVMNMFPGGSTLQIPLEACTAFSATAGNAQVELTWTDPLDKYATPEGDISDTGDQLVSEWDHTVLVRKTGSQPAGPNDGTVVVSSSVRDQYQTTPYTDTGLTNDTEYFYGVFAYNKDGVASEGAFVTATPKAGTPLSELAEGTLIKINENGSPVEFYLAKHNYEPGLNGQGRELCVRKDCYNQRFIGANSAWDNDMFSATDMFQWLQNSYAVLFSSEVRAAIGTTIYDSIKYRGSFYMSTASSAFFLLSITELGRSYADVLEEGENLPTDVYVALWSSYLNGSPINQWTRTPDPTFGQQWLSLQNGGHAETEYRSASLGSRPCFTLPNTAKVNSTMDLMEESLTT